MGDGIDQAKVRVEGDTLNDECPLPFLCLSSSVAFAWHRYRPVVQHNKEFSEPSLPLVGYQVRGEISPVGQGATASR